MNRVTRARTIRSEFWRMHPELSRRRIRDYSGSGLMYPADVRVAFCDFVDSLYRFGYISERLAQSVTLD
jgi:hypothetical protein